MISPIEIVGTSGELSGASSTCGAIFSGGVQGAVSMENGLSVDGFGGMELDASVLPFVPFGSAPLKTGSSEEAGFSSVTVTGGSEEIGGSIGGLTGGCPGITGGGF